MNLFLDIRTEVFSTVKGFGHRGGNVESQLTSTLFMNKVTFIIILDIYGGLKIYPNGVDKKSNDYISLYLEAIKHIMRNKII